jgi:hypothetical protein
MSTSIRQAAAEEEIPLQKKKRNLRLEDIAQKSLMPSMEYFLLIEQAIYIQFAVTVLF